jgi:hypothetical protein
MATDIRIGSNMADFKVPGRHLPNFPDDSNVNPVYSRNSGNPPIDQGFNNNPMSKKLTNWAKKNKRTFLPDTKRK